MLIRQEFASSGGIHPPLAVSSRMTHDGEFQMITQSELKELLQYNPSTGLFYSKKKCRNNKITGKTEWFINDEYTRHTGVTNKLGYVVIGVNYKTYYAHRLAWLYIYGVLPNTIDHIDRNKENNKICNLREVTTQENCRNHPLRHNNTSKVNGVSKAKGRKNKWSGKWRAYITVKSKQINLGNHNDWFDAVCARMSANNKYGYHANHGR